MIFAEGIFEGESMVVHPTRPRGEIEIPLKFPNNKSIDVHVKTCVGANDSELFVILELTHRLPQFCMYEVVPRPYDLPKNFKDCGVVAEVLVV